MTFCIKKLYFLNEGQKSPQHRLPRTLRNQLKADFATSPAWVLTAPLKGTSTAHSYLQALPHGTENSPRP